jgi:exosortase
MKTWLPRAGVLALALFAYRPLVLAALQLPTAHRLEAWLFRPSQLPLPLVLGVAGWLCWRRREPGSVRAPDPWRAGATAFAATGALFYFWAVLTRASDLLLVSLAANALAFAAARTGRAGARALLLPALVLLLGLQIPAPLRNEIVWFLQRATATGAEHVLSLFRSDFANDGVILRSAQHSFHVIDGCSGLQGITTLLLVAVIVGELHALSRGHRWLVVAVAPVLGYALNVARIAYIAASPNPEAYAGLQGDHTPQGLALLAAGSALLYALGRLWAPRDPPERSAPAPGTVVAAASPIRIALGLSALAITSLVLPPFGPRELAFEPRTVRFPAARAGWTSEPITGDPYFIAPPLPGQLLYRRYAQSSDPELIEAVDVFIALDPEESDQASELLSSKRHWPGPDWNLEQRRRARLWDLGHDADFAVAGRTTRPERAVVYSWTIRHGGLALETARSLLALEASPLRREQKRAVVRIVAFAPFDEPLAIDRAKQRLDRFATVFRDDFNGL